MRFPINGEDTFKIEAGITLKTHLVENTGRSAGQALWPEAKAFGQKTRRVALSATPAPLSGFNLTYPQTRPKNKGGVKRNIQVI